MVLELEELVEVVELLVLVEVDVEEVVVVVHSVSLADHA